MGGCRLGGGNGLDDTGRVDSLSAQYNTYYAKIREAKCALGWGVSWCQGGHVDGEWWILDLQ